MKQCPNYCGVACIDGNCPIANRDEYAERGYDTIDECDDCWHYKGCDDCAFYDTEICPKKEAEELFNTLEKQRRALAEVKSESEQIEEMAKVIHGYCKAKCPDGGCSYCVEYMKAEAIYNAGYRKQSDGEWIEQVRVSKDGKPLLVHYKCNLCGVYLATQANFCPNCGGKMKGSAE